MSNEKDLRIQILDIESGLLDHKLFGLALDEKQEELSKLKKELLGLLKAEG
mgnify:CR=1 FL=1